MVSFIGAGPGDPELLTIKGKKIIDSADVIIYAGSLESAGSGWSKRGSSDL